MNDNIILTINKCVEAATAAKEGHKFQEFQYFKGQLVGLGMACLQLGFTDEGRIAQRLARGYPFKEGGTKTDFGKILDIRDSKGEKPN